MREFKRQITPLDMDFSRPRPISPGASLSAKDVSMMSSISWEGELVYERPRTAEQIQRRPSMSESIYAEPNPNGLPPDIWRILHSHYVAFSIDMAAIASMCKDPAKREALMQVQPKRYVGLVVWSGYMNNPDEDNDSEVLTTLFVANGPPPIPQAEHMCLPIDPSPPVRKQVVAQGSSITMADDDTTMAVDGVFEMDGEFRGHGTQDGSNNGDHYQMDEDGSEAMYDPYQVPADFGPLTAIRHPTLLPLKGRVQWLTFGTRLKITTLEESSLSFFVDDGEDQPPFEWRRLEGLITEHVTALHKACPPPDADDEPSDDTPDASRALLEKLRVPEHPIPAIVWRDIRGEHEDDPTEFVHELDRIRTILGEPRE